MASLLLCIVEMVYTETLYIKSCRSGKIEKHVDFLGFYTLTFQFHLKLNIKCNMLLVLCSTYKVLPFRIFTILTKCYAEQQL